MLILIFLYYFHWLSGTINEIHSNEVFLLVCIDPINKVVCSGIHRRKADQAATADKGSSPKHLNCTIHITGDGPTTVTLQYNTLSIISSMDK